MSTSNGHGENSSEYDPLLSNYSEDGHLSHRQQPQPVGEEWSQGQQWTVDVVKSVMKKLLSIYILLVFVPFGLLAGVFRWNAILTASINFLAIIPLSAVVSAVSDKLNSHLGFLAGALINATFGNIVELSVGVIAILHNEIGLAQSTMLGSILSDILLVLGACLIAAARGTRVLKFNHNVVNTLSSLMIITAVALILPTALSSTFPNAAHIDVNILSFSRSAACVLLLVYLAYLYFQFWTHASVFVKEVEDVSDQEDARQGRRQSVVAESGYESSASDEPGGEWPVMRAVLPATTILVTSGIAIMVCTHLFFDNLGETANFFHLSQTFIALIIIPLVSNAPEGTTVIAASRKHQIDFAIGVIVGSILQISLFVLPFLVIFGWIVGRRMTLYFEVSQTFILFLSLLMVNHLLGDGKYTYLHGVMLLSLYAVIVMAFLLQTDN